MKTRLRILLPLLLVCTALLAMALCASAATETGACGANLTYTLDTAAGTLTITGTGAMTDWSHVDNVPWHASRASVRSVVLPQGLTTVGARAFYGCSKLTSASIPAGVTRIGASAFADCTALASVTMPAGMTEIGDLAFFACGMTGITLPTGLEKIGDAAFAACKKLTRLEIPAGVARIGDMTFSLCDSLADITLTEHLNTVGTGAFTYCQNLQSITLPAGVEVVEELAFYGYTNLKTVKVLNPQCAISDEDETIPKSAAIYGYDSSTAESYAAEKGLKFISLGVAPHVHTYAETYKVDEAATCAAPGTESRHCTYPGCTATTDAREIPIDKDAHDFETDFTVDTPADCIHAGAESRHCTRCDAVTDTREIPATGKHIPAAEWFEDTPASCTAPGSKSHHCTTEGCTAKLDVTEIPKKAHNYVNGFCSDCGAEKPPYTPGDCNEDGKVTKADLLRLQKYLARWDVEINLDAADCNGDGNVSKADLLRLQKYLAGWDVKLGE